MAGCYPLRAAGRFVGVPSILIVRHGQASFGGANYDVLSEQGHAQVDALRRDLERRGLQPRVVVSGTLARQRDTAAPLAGALGSPLEIDARWNEYDTNDVLTHHSSTTVREDRPPGSTVPEVSSRRFQELLEEALLAWIGAGGQGPAAESWPSFAGRVAAGLADVGRSLQPRETAIVSTSGGVLAALCVALLGVPDECFVLFNRVTVNTGVTMVASGRSGMTLISFNEQGHLERPGSSLTTYR
jgi:broad specificity phosphatase PhoE